MVDQHPAREVHVERQRSRRTCQDPILVSETVGRLLVVWRQRYHMLHPEASVHPCTQPAGRRGCSAASTHSEQHRLPLQGCLTGQGHMCCC